MLGFMKQKAYSLADDAYRWFVYQRLYRKYQAYTMVKPTAYENNLAIVAQYKEVPGCVIECGTWRGGMIAGMAEILGPDRQYYLFDSFEGLPPAKQIDGAPALAWQLDKDGATYYNNCRADQESAVSAMKISGAMKVEIVRGWFEDTLPSFRAVEQIAILRLDSDWFESTLTCLECLYEQMSSDGLIIVDDYYTWDGCARAIHQFFASTGFPARLQQLHGLCVIKPNFDRVS